MRHFQDEWIQEWCQENGWTDFSKECYGHYWAFPPGAVMPEPIPSHVLKAIKDQKGLIISEKLWSGIAVGLTIGAILWSVFYPTPVPLVLAFACDALIVASLEIEDS